jgi:rhomboid family GlyGly-CTERM serine protease
LLVPAGIAAVCLATAVLGESARQRLRYERIGLVDGEWWRAVTAHLVHLGPTHTLLNVAALAALAWLFIEEIRPAQWLLCGLLAALAIAAGLYLGDPQTQWYVGLSGVLHGWFVLGAARTSETRRSFGLIMLLGIVVKLAFEQLAGTMPFTQALEIGPVIVDAHLYGAVAGALFYVISRLKAVVGRSGAPL